MWSRFVSSSEQDTLWQSRIRLREAFFNQIVAHPVPLDMHSEGDEAASLLLPFSLAPLSKAFPNEGQAQNSLTQRPLFPLGAPAIP